MKLKAFNLCILFALIFGDLSAQTVSGIVKNAETQEILSNVEVYNLTNGEIYRTDSNGQFSSNILPEKTYTLAVINDEFKIYQKELTAMTNGQVEVFLVEPLVYNITEVQVRAREEIKSTTRRLKEVEGTEIYAGKKNEVVLMDNAIINKAANNARQIYAEVAGLNIYVSDDAGLQLNIGGRGLDPNRTANFNTRQNGYDISADVLGYPESYYSPPAEAVNEIQIVRGAASLQYGTQFGGLVNFKLKEANPNKKIEVLSRQTIGSNALFTSFNQLNGALGKFSYNTYYNFKQGDGFRPNSEFDSHNAFAQIGYRLSEKTKLSAEFTYLDYLAQQPGGHTDLTFYTDPFSSNRTRNFFEVDWKLWNAKLEHQIKTNQELSLSVFGLNAKRNALGFRTNRVSQIDDINEPRDLIKGEFNNWGAEAKWLNRYKFQDLNGVLLIGSKYYSSNNNSQQGAGNNGTEQDFSIRNNVFSDYPNQNQFDFPNENVALFAENIFYLTDQFSLTPGVRLEHILTEADGTFRSLNFDLAGNVIQDSTFVEQRSFDRTIFLTGLGASFKANKHLEIYANFSQNYRSVTFNDIRTVNPSFQIDENISDEDGFTTDLGFRGQLNDVFQYDIGGFMLLYDDRLGEVVRAETRINADGLEEETGRVVRFRGNIGQARMYGLESYADWNFGKSIWPNDPQWYGSAFVNASFIGSEYTESEIPNVEGREVEFIPDVNLKTGLRMGYQNVLASLQYTHIGEQFTDASNAPQDRADNQIGVIGSIPAYSVMDLSGSYKWRSLKLEAGVNNLLDETYFSRRATGYPGPGIIPDAPRTYYATLQVKL